MQDIDSDYPRLKPHATSKDCVPWLRQLTCWMGPGFHPESSADQYIVADEAGRWLPSFTPALCERIDADMDRCYALLEPLGKDPCSIAVKVQRRLLGWTRAS